MIESKKNDLFSQVPPSTNGKDPITPNRPAREILYLDKTVLLCKLPTYVTNI